MYRALMPVAPHRWNIAELTKFGLVCVWFCMCVGAVFLCTQVAAVVTTFDVVCGMIGVLLTCLSETHTVERQKHLDHGSCALAGKIRKIEMGLLIIGAF